MASISIETYKSSVLISPPIEETLPVSLVFKAVLSGISGVTSCKWELIHNDIVQGDMILSDQTTISVEQFSNTFTAPTDYKISLTIIDDSLIPVTYTSILDVVISDDVSIQATPSYGKYPLVVKFTPLTLPETDTLRDYIHWDFKNVGYVNSELYSPTYTYNDPADYVCKLSVRWVLIDKYNSDSFVYILIEKTLKVYVTYNSLSLSISVDPQQGRTPFTTIISGASTNPVTNWDWYIDNVLQGEHTQQIERTFTQRGTHAVKLVASDIYGSGYFVSVGDAGALLISSEGSSWQVKASNTVENLRSIIYGEGKYVAVGNSGVIITSEDGISWTNRTSGTANNLYAITYDGDQFLAVGDLGTVITSEDGITWAVRTSGVSNALYSVTSGGGQYIAVGDTGEIIASLDGISWDIKTSGTLEDINSVFYEDGLFIAVCNSGIILSSSDGTTWVVESSGTTEDLKSITYGNDLFIVVGDAGTILTSSDGSLWTSQTSGTSVVLYSVIHDVSRFLIIGHNGTSSITLMSYEGSLWTLRELSTNKAINSAIYGAVPKSTTSSIYVAASQTVIDYSLSESDPNRFMGFEGSSDVIPSNKGISVKGAISDNFRSSGFTHEIGPNIIFS